MPENASAEPSEWPRLQNTRSFRRASGFVLTAQALLTASIGSATWKLGRLEGFGRFKVQDYENRDTREELK